MGALERCIEWYITWIIYWHEATETTALGAWSNFNHGVRGKHLMECTDTG